MIGQKGIPTNSGGIERHVESLSQELVKLGHEVIVYARPHYTPKSLKEYKGVKLISLPSIKTKNLDAATHTFFATLHALFCLKNVDILHYHAIGPSLFIIIAKILKPKIKIVSTFHCQDYYHQKWSPLARLFLKLGEKISVCFANKTIVVSKELKHYVEQKYKHFPVYIPNGIYPEAKKTITAADKESLKWWKLKSEQYIITVNRLVRHKGIHTLISAYQKLAPEFQKSKKLVIVGSPAFTDDYEKALKQLANNNPNIIFTGQQTGRSLKILFQNAYLFVQASESEGLSISLLEAMNYGIPVLASNIPANAEIVEGYGFLFENKNIQDLYNQLFQILSLPKANLEKKSTLGQKRVADFYNWSRIGIETSKLYKKLIDALQKTKALDKSRIFFALKIKKI